MSKNRYTAKILLFSAFLGFVACDDDEIHNIRTSVDYATITNTTPYTGNDVFVDANGATTVDVTDGNLRLKMFKALNDTIRNLITANSHVDAALLNNMFKNENDRFKDATLNATALSLNNSVGTSRTATEITQIQDLFSTHFTEIETASHSIANTASAGNAGKLGSYLVDDQGIELIQVIQKSLIGALQLDYISNVLLDEGLTANNHSLVDDKNYTQLEHNWDVAYGALTLNPIYAEGWTLTTKNTAVTEFAGGSYIWEYNKDDFEQIYPAFLKGRAAIINNDKAELQVQATFIRTAFEKAIANAAIGYLEKVKTNGITAAGAHAFGEGLGFVYSLRFAQAHGADAAFSDGLITSLMSGANGFWDIETTKINQAIADIKTKFGIQ
jgi:hypothetical protein